MKSTKAVAVFIVIFLVFALAILVANWERTALVEVNLPDTVEVDIPAVELSEAELPEVELPEVELPEEVDPATYLADSTEVLELY